MRTRMNDDLQSLMNFFAPDCGHIKGGYCSRGNARRRHENRVFNSTLAVTVYTDAAVALRGDIW